MEHKLRPRIQGSLFGTGSGGGDEIRKAPMAYVPDLPAKVLQLLQQNDRYFKYIAITSYTTRSCVDWIDYRPTVPSFLQGRYG